MLAWGNHDVCGEQCNFDADDPAVADSRTLQILKAQATSIPNGASAAVRLLRRRRARHGGCEIYSVSVVDERYRLVHAPTVIELQTLFARRARAAIRAPE